EESCWRACSLRPTPRRLERRRNSSSNTVGAGKNPRPSSPNAYMSALSSNSAISVGRSFAASNHWARRRGAVAQLRSVQPLVQPAAHSGVVAGQQARRAIERSRIATPEALREIVGGEEARGALAQRDMYRV